MESRRNNIEVVLKALSDLAIMLDVDDNEIEDMVENMPFNQLHQYVQDYSLCPQSMDSARFTGMMKMYCRGGV